MDELDHNLLMAWNRVFEVCKNNPSEARRRYERTLPGTILSRPARAWCVGIRASDTRIDALNAGDSDAVDWNDEQGRVSDDFECQSLAEWMGTSPSSPEPSLQGGESESPPLPPYSPSICAHQAHEIMLTGEMIQQIGGPVWLKYPGLPLKEAAALLGRNEATMIKWLPVKVGKTVQQKQALADERSGFGQRRWATYEDPKTRWGVRYVPCGAAGRKAGMEVPEVWHDGPLDPGAYQCRPPFKHWGSLWMSLAEKIPAEFEQVIERVPTFQNYKDGQRFRGWMWRCPGLPSNAMREPGRDEASYCGRLVRHLYAPLPTWTVGRALGIDEGLEVGGLKARWKPGVDDRWAGRRRLACERCWQIKRQTFTNSTGWNELVGYLSGGLLYGRDVEVPFNFQYERKRAYRKRRGRGGGQSG